jgi:hypothetical protein
MGVASAAASFLIVMVLATAIFGIETKLKPLEAIGDGNQQSPSGAPTTTWQVGSLAKE